MASFLAIALLESIGLNDFVSIRLYRLNSVWSKWLNSNSCEAKRLNS